MNKETPEWAIRGLAYAQQNLEHIFMLRVCLITSTSQKEQREIVELLQKQEEQLKYFVEQTAEWRLRNTDYKNAITFIKHFGMKDKLELQKQYIEVKNKYDELSNAYWEYRSKCVVLYAPKIEQQIKEQFLLLKELTKQIYYER